MFINCINMVTLVTCYIYAECTAIYLNARTAPSVNTAQIAAAFSGRAAASVCPPFMDKLSNHAGRM